MRMRPERTASAAGAASSSIRMNHCSEMSGSTRSPERCEYGTVWTWSSVARMAPCASRAATTAARASSTLMPANSPAASVMRPSSPMTEISSSPCRRPISKSLGSCPGVIFRQPVPKSVFT